MKKSILLILFTLSIFEIGFSGTSGQKDSLSKIVKTSSDRYQQAKALYELSLLKFEEKKYPSALKDLKTAVTLLDKNSNSFISCKIYFQIGKVYNSIYRYEEALKYYLKALKIAEVQKKNKYIVNIQTEIGLLYAGIQNFKGALVYFKLAKKATNKMYKNPYNYGNITLLKYIGIVYGQMGKYPTSISYSNRAFQLCLKSKDCPQSEMSGMVNNIGVCYLFNKELDKANEFFNTAYELCVDQNDPKTMGNICANLGDIYVEKQQSNKAIEYYTKALEYKKHTTDPKELFSIYKTLSGFYSNLGDYKKALEYKELFLVQKEKISNTSMINNISDIKNQYEIDKIEYQFEIDAKERKMKMYALIVSIIVLVIFGLLIFRNLRIRIKNAKLKQKMLHNEQKLLEKELKIKNNEIENFAKRIVEKNEFSEIIQEQLEKIETELNYKNQELEAFALTLVEKNDFLEKVKDKFSEIQRSNQNNESIKEISNLIKTNLYIEKDREEFDVKLENIQKSFLLKLETNFPELTKTEKRLSSLLVMGLSTKEIATLMNISPDGVKKSRFRLRKKLNLETTQDVGEFLKKL